MYGYVYILSNEEMPGVVKIGCSKNGGLSRAKTQTYNFCDTPFQLEFELYCLHFYVLEKELHKHLKKYRPNKQKELFEIPLTDAIKALLDVYSKKYIPKSKKRKNNVIQLPQGINSVAWTEWSQFRREEKKKPITESAARKQIQLLIKYNLEDQQRIIDNSIQNDYQGLFPLRSCPNERTQGLNQTRRSSAIDRVKANTAARREERESRGFGGQALGEANGDVRLQVCEPVRGDAGRDMGNVLDGDYWETNG